VIAFRMRFASPSLLLASALACACTPKDEVAGAPEKTEPATAPVEPEPTPVATADGPEYFIGVAGQTGIPHCPDGKQEWLGISPTIGFIGVGGPGSENLEKLIDRPVLARGSAGSRPGPRPSATEPIPCMVMQMRSDWVLTPRGIVVDDGNGPNIEYFNTTSVRALDELTIRREGSEIVVELRNPLPFAIAELGMAMHYEGCYGKPGSRTIQRSPDPLAAGETRTNRFPLFAEQEDDGAHGAGREHAAHSLALTGNLSGEATVHLDLDVKLATMGAAVECPD
jgi:hypothetical protein